MNLDKLLGGAWFLFGRTQRRLGHAVGNRGAQFDGAMHQIKGGSRYAYGYAHEEVRGAVIAAPAIIDRSVREARRIGNRGLRAVSDSSTNRTIAAVAGALALGAFTVHAIRRRR